jgi:hypothetical protein
MTAPIPSPSEQATIDRLGLFDEEKFAEITEGTFPCDICTPAASWLITMRCCDASGRYCDTHYAWTLRNMHRLLQAGTAGCMSCGRVFGHGLTVTDVAEVVIL